MNHDEDITEIFNSYLAQHKSVDIAERVFKQSLAEDPELREMYKEWCHEVGSSEKCGFTDYCEEYLERQNEVWDALNDYDNEE
ncbi:MAG: hypothetical protein K2K40_01015 [Paramuribaculum sp.]|nr:hypothetical protein [Candidatus Amulumruptor sp.]MDE6586899.1 hypothetical protein [Paramuribaculum sp.]MDE7151722.1 hypothetical protein [Candidatus Amulumruptor sp.]MDE7236418.1 hypothetical protein [Paramuribaculum sp.]